MLECLIYEEEYARWKPIHVVIPSLLVCVIKSEYKQILPYILYEAATKDTHYEQNSGCYICEDANSCRKGTEYIF